MTSEEQIVYIKIANMKRENELLLVVLEELEDLVRSGYNGPLISEDTSGIFYAIKEYRNWAANKLHNYDVHL